MGNPLEVIGGLVGGYFGGPAGASLGSSIGGAIGGSRDRKRDNKRDDSRFQRASADAKKAGLHPLFALGAAGAGSPSFITGQSKSGSLSKEAITQMQTMRKGKSEPDQSSIIASQTALAAVELARHVVSNDTAQTITIPKHQPLGQVVKLGETDAHMTKNENKVSM